MKRKRRSHAAFYNSRFLAGFALCLTGVLLASLALGLDPSARAQGLKQNREISAPRLVPMVGPVSQDQDLRTLPHIAPNPEIEELRLTRYPPSQIQSHGTTDPIRGVRQAAQAAAMPTPIATFAGMNSTQSGCGCLPPDTHGDVGPNHYVQSVNSSIKIFDKTGTQLNGSNGTTYNSFFSGLSTSGTPCGINQNRGDGFVFYDQLADRWVVSDFAFPNFPGVSFYQCIGVSKTSDPVAGGWWLYALQVDPANPSYLGDYPKFGLWPDAYYLSVNMFSNSTTFQGVRVYALPRAAMINGTGAPNPGAVAFTIPPAGLGDSYSLVPATFRAGSAPPTGTPEYFLAVDSPPTANVVLTEVKAWKFHVDFGTFGNSTFGIGANRTPNGKITVNDFVDAFTTTNLLVPQNGTTAKLDTLGDKLMTPLVYQNLGGTESLWASQTVNNNQNGTGPTAIRWYQFDVTGGTIPATPVQQQTFNNGGDGLWRWMPSITVDAQGNMAIGYSVSSSTSEPSIRYAGRLAADALNLLPQGEAILIAGGGHQTHSAGRWGDYSEMSIDPSDNLTFWHTNEYFTTTSSASWDTRIGKFKFPAPPSPTSVVSRKTHGNGAGTFDVTLLPLPANGIGIECRTGGTTLDHTVVATFALPVTVSGNGTVKAQVTSGAGDVGTGGVANGNAITVSGAVVTIPLTNVEDAQQLSITLFGVSDGTNSGNVVIPMGVLLGDVSANRSVNATDTSQVQAQSGKPVNDNLGTSNFRTDVNVNGQINSTDTSIVQSRSGTGF